MLLCILFAQPDAETAISRYIGWRASLCVVLGRAGPMRLLRALYHIWRLRLVRWQFRALLHVGRFCIRL
jgi:hypothetical protein